MKKQLSIILGLLFACCFVSAPAMASHKKGDKFTPAYATLIHDGSLVSYSTADIILPFSIQTTRGITLDATDNTKITLPKGVYSLNFDISMYALGGTGDEAASFRFSDMFLDLNNGSSTVSLNWTVTRNLVPTDTNYTTLFRINFSGSKVFAVGSDNTVVQFKMLRNLVPAPPNANIVFGPDYPSGNSSPITVALHKIDGCN
jgi:hypothetical protein